MKTALKTALVIAVVGAALTTLANAQCVSTGPYHPSALRFHQQPSVGGFVPAAFTPAVSGGVEAAPAAAQEAVVGFWKFKLLSEHNTGVPDGTVIDEGYSQWHSDGTEIMNSSRPPATGNFCLGVWAKTGPFTYKLNHYAIGWNPDGTMQGPARIQETITVSRDRSTFSGTFSLDQYNQAGTVQMHRDGRVEGTRITLTTPISGALLN
jgi:hypothetical protein